MFVFGSCCLCCPCAQSVVVTLSDSSLRGPQLRWRLWRGFQMAVWKVCVILLLKRSCCGLLRSTPVICPTPDGGSSVRPSDKVEETCWLFSSNKELLIAAAAAAATAAAAAFKCKSLFLPHIFFLSMNLPKSACPCLLCEHVTVCGRYQPPTATSCQRTRQGQKAAVQPDEEM